MATNQFEWDDLRVFLAIYRGRSVRSAARIMEVSHSTISRRLQAMEDQMERKLFLRHQNGFILTETGEAMVERAERVETEILSMQREVFGKDSTLAGVIRITAIPQIVQHKSSPCWILSHPDVFATERVRIFVRFLHNYLTERKARLSGESS